MKTLAIRKIGVDIKSNPGYTLYMMKTETDMNLFEHAQFFQTGDEEIGAEASTLGLKVGKFPKFFFLEHAGTFKFVRHDSNGVAHYVQFPGFLKAVIFND